MMDESRKEELIENWTRAIIAILDAISEHDEIGARAPARRSTPLVIYSLDELEQRANTGGRYLVDPIGAALRAGLRELGRIMARTITIEEMSRVCDIAASGPQTNILDKSWDGITDFKGALWLA